MSHLTFEPAGGAGTAAGGAPVAANMGDTRVLADAVVLATDVRSGRRLVAEADGFPDDAAAARLAATANAPAFVVWRLWLDRPVHADRPEFLGTGGFELLDNVSVVSGFEDGARAFAERRGGSVVEVHAYALPDGWTEPDVRRGAARGAGHRVPGDRTRGRPR